MKKFSQIISEVAEPKSGDEQRFKAAHVVTKVGHPVALDHQFTGEIEGIGSTVRIADHKKGEDEAAYDPSYVEKDKQFTLPRNVDEAMDPVNAKALKGKHKDRKDKDIDNDGDVDDSDEYLHKRRKAVSKAIKGKETETEVQTQESVDLDEVSMDTAKDVFMKRKMQAFDAAHRGDRKQANKLADKKNKTKAYIAKRESVEEATMDTAAGRKKASAEADAHHNVMVKKWGANHPATKDAANAAKVMKQKAMESVSKAIDSTEKQETVSEAATPQMMKCAKELEAYAKKHGGIDKADFMKAAKMLASGKAGTNLVKFVDGLDTDPREKIITCMGKHMGNKTVGKMFGVNIRENTKRTLKSLINEISRSMTPMRNKFGGTVIPKKFDAYKKHMKTHKLDEPTVRMIHQNPDEAESKRMMKNPKYAKAVDMYKASIKEEADLTENPMEEKPMMMNALRSMSHNIMGIARYVQSTQDPEEWFQNKLAGVAKEMQTLYSYATAEVMSMGEEAELDESQKAALAKELSKASATSEKGKKAVTLKPAPWEKKEAVDETTLSAIKKPVNMTGPDGKTRTVYKTVKNRKTDDHGQDKISTNESNDILDEAFKPGIVKFKNGQSMILKKEDSDILNKMLKSLSKNNRTKMENLATKDKKGFAEILGFAKEAI